jgi:hypothetical protein
MRKRAAEIERQMFEEVDRVRRSLRAEIVPYKAYDVTGISPEDEDGDSVTIPVERPADGA